MGQGRGCAQGRTRTDGPGVRAQARRRCVLRPEDRLRRQRQHRPQVAAGHDPARLQRARALRHVVHRRGQQGASSDLGSAMTRYGTRPRVRSRPHSNRRAWRTSSSPATVRSTARRSTSTSATASAASGSWARSSSTTTRPSASTCRTSARTTRSIVRSRIGDDALWDKAEGALKAALEQTGLAYELKPGDGAFYGPKIDFDVSDSIGRKWQLGTIQLDYNAPERFDMSYIGEDNKEHRPISDRR